MATPNGFDVCKVCKGRTLVNGWDLCERHTEAAGMIPIATLADAIVKLDQDGVLEQDRRELFTRFNVTHKQLQAAQEIVEERYAAAGFRRRRYRGW